MIYQYSILVTNNSMKILPNAKLRKATPVICDFITTEGILPYIFGHFLH